MLHVPVFPLNAVVFPGVVIPLHVFEDRYRALVRDLRHIEAPSDRVFAIPAIREGYEVGSHGVQSMHRVGTLVQLSQVEARPDGSIDIEVTGRHRVRIDALHPTEEYLTAEVTDLADVDEDAARPLAADVLARFTSYAEALARLTGIHMDLAAAPGDPAYLSYWMAAMCPLALHQRQTLLEADSATDRLVLFDAMLRREITAMNVVPSLPATELARNRWSPN
ncbi:MAG: peptidase S16 [Myxococcales bacterium]|nr:MAG: peptidase S16 [Myxococcales bacterium]